MRLPAIRPMTPADVDAATELLLRNDWGVRREWLHVAATQPQCHPFVAEADGAIVATGVGSANGAVGWIGTIFVAPDRRGGGLGRAMTQAAIDVLDAAGCRALALVATQAGRLLYERMGFEVTDRYRILEIEGRAAARPGSADGATATSAGGRGGGLAVRPFHEGDLDGMAALDLAATGEDRRYLLERFATPESAKVVVEPDAAIGGFVVRAPWGGGATIAPSIPTALAILDARRLVAGPSGRVRVGILASNAAGSEAAERAGLTPAWSAPRMTRGMPVAWHPDWIWGQFNHAVG